MTMTAPSSQVVDVELHRDTLVDDHIPLTSSSKPTPRAASPADASQSLGPSSSRNVAGGDKGTGGSVPPREAEQYRSIPASRPPPASVKVEAGRPADGGRPGERTPTRPKAGDRLALGSHGNSAFQPITASCKIVPQGQAPSPAESPGKSFQPITMSCKIVSGEEPREVAQVVSGCLNARPSSPLTGSPISTPSHSPLPRTPATSTPVHSKQSSSSVLNNPYIIVDKPGGMASSSTASAGTPPPPAPCPRHAEFPKRPRGFWPHT